MLRISEYNVAMCRVLLLLSMACLVGGCWEERVVRDSWADFAAATGAQMGGRDPVAYAANSGDPTGGQGWSIRLHAYRGSDRMKKAQRLVQRLQETSELKRLFVEDARGAATIFYGRFDDPQDVRAQTTLDDIRSISLENRKPFADAQLVALMGHGRIFADPFDLKQFAGYYSVQIGFYDQNYPGNFRIAAEEAARTLRADGDEAYFYHGPIRSIVTVGLFSREQAFIVVDNPMAPGSTIEKWSPPVRELADKYPYNLGNGLTLIQSVGGHSIGEQKSSLIRVPKIVTREL